MKEPRLIQEYHGEEMVAYPEDKIGGTIVFWISAKDKSLRIHVGNAFCMCHDMELVVPPSGESFVSIPQHVGGQMDWGRTPATPEHFAKARARCREFGVEIPTSIEGE